jgi:hypothetical protein
MSWAGDQTVDWTASDGLPSSVIAALSLAVSGMGLSHSDIGTEIHTYGHGGIAQGYIRTAANTFLQPRWTVLPCVQTLLHRKGDSPYHTGLYGVRKIIKNSPYDLAPSPSATPPPVSKLSLFLRENGEITELLGIFWDNMGKKNYKSRIVIDELIAVKKFCRVEIVYARLSKGRNKIFLKTGVFVEKDTVPHHLARDHNNNLFCW